jgi:hypothetical protein
VKTEELSAEQKEMAVATANLVVTAMVRLERDCGERAFMEALRLIISALPSNERREAIMRALAAQAKEQAGAVAKQSCDAACHQAPGVGLMMRSTAM